MSIRKKFTPAEVADLDNLPAPDEIAADIIENLQSALESFQELMSQLK